MSTALSYQGLATQETANSEREQKKEFQETSTYAATGRRISQILPDRPDNRLPSSIKTDFIINVMEVKPDRSLSNT